MALTTSASLAVSFGLALAAAYGFGRRLGTRPWWRNLATGRGFFVGGLLAFASIRGVALLPSSWHRISVTAILVGTAAVYVGFALVDRRPSRITLEVAWATAVVAAAIAGFLLLPAWLSVGFLAHVAWDMLHQGTEKRIDTRTVPGWYPASCAGYDIPLAVAALLLG